MILLGLAREQRPKAEPSAKRRRIANRQPALMSAMAMGNPSNKSRPNIFVPKRRADDAMGVDQATIEPRCRCRFEGLPRTLLDFGYFPRALSRAHLGLNLSGASVCT